MNKRPRLLITLGDVAGIGPEVVAKAWGALQDICEPIVIGDVGWMRRASTFAGHTLKVVSIEQVELGRPSPEHIPVIQGTSQELAGVQVGMLSAAAGRAAYDFVCVAIHVALARQADGIVTLPLNKEGLHAAGLHYPGHTEILAEKTGVREFGMMLYAPPTSERANAIGVVHVTLHMRLRDVFAHITTGGVLEKIRLIDGVMRRLIDGPERRPRLVVAALNPHASDGGIFGDEEATIIAPAVERARQDGIDVVGPLPCDTLFVRAAKGEFDGVVAMVHDQGHIALKLLTGLAAVNVTLGLPIVRTSVAHGTAYDIAGKGVADPQSLLEAARVAARLAQA